MIKIIASLLMMLSLAGAGAAQQQVTVLKSNVKYGGVQGVMPYIDGTANEDYERMANGVIIKTVKEMVKKIDGKGTITYGVQLNRPSIVALLLKATNEDKICYRSLNLDLTKGNDASIHEFFVADKNTKELLGEYKSFLMGEKGVYLQDDSEGGFTRFIPYAQFLTSVRIGEAGRIFQIARLTRNSENKTLVIPKNSLLAIQLDANPTTGYRWEAVLPPEGQIMKVASSFILPPHEKERVGVPGKEVLFFYTRQDGLYDVEFRYRRSWENFNVDKFKMTIAVRES